MDDIDFDPERLLSLLSHLQDADFVSNIDDGSARVEEDGNAASKSSSEECLLVGLNNVRSNGAEEEEDDDDDEPQEEHDEHEDDDDMDSVVLVAQEHSSSNDLERDMGRPTGLMSAKRSRFSCNFEFISKETHLRYLSLFLVNVDFDTFALSTTISLDWINSSSVTPETYLRLATNVAMNSCNGVIIILFLSFVFLSDAVCW